MPTDTLQSHPLVVQARAIQVLPEPPQLAETLAEGDQERLERLQAFNAVLRDIQGALSDPALKGCLAIDKSAQAEQQARDEGDESLTAIKSELQQQVALLSYRLVVLRCI